MDRPTGIPRIEQLEIPLDSFGRRHTFDSVARPPVHLRRLGARAGAGSIATRERPMCLGIPGKIVELRDDTGLAMGLVDFGGVRREVCLAYVSNEATLGAYVIVHVGFAISVVDESEAHRTFEVLREMSQLDELEWLGDIERSSTP